MYGSSDDISEEDISDSVVGVVPSGDDVEVLYFRADDEEEDVEQDIEYDEEHFECCEGDGSVLVSEVCERYACESVECDGDSEESNEVAVVIVSEERCYVL